MTGVRGPGAATLWRAPRRAAVRVLREVQGLPAYRRIGRRLAPPFTIVEATPADVAALRRRKSPEARRRTPTADPNETRWVARHGSRVAGGVRLVMYPEDRAPWTGWWLDSLEVRAFWRGFGIGEALARRVVTEAPSLGAAELLLVVRSDNERALRLYHRLGFEYTTVAGLKPVLAAGKKASGLRHVIMRKVLSDAVIADATLE